MNASNVGQFIIKSPLRANGNERMKAMRQLDTEIIILKGPLRNTESIQQLVDQIDLTKGVVEKTQAGVFEHLNFDLHSYHLSTILSCILFLQPTFKNLLILQYPKCSAPFEWVRENFKCKTVTLLCTNMSHRFIAVHLSNIASGTRQKLAPQHLASPPVSSIMSYAKTG